MPPTTESSHGISIPRPEEACYSPIHAHHRGHLAAPSGWAWRQADAAKIEELAGLLTAANTWKQAGFYSDFDPDSGSWSSPGILTDADFAKIRTLIGDYVSETQRQLDEFTRYRTAGQATAGS
jgi:hypothetical protein